MSDQVFFCPGCRKAYDNTRRPPKGQLFDCPDCQLLFLPADKDFAGGVAPREHETERAVEEIRVAPKPPSARPIRRRLKPQRPHELLIVWITGGAMLAIAAIIIAIVASARGNRSQTSTVEQAAQPVAITSISPTSESPPPSVPATLDEKTILGEWESIDQPIVGPFRGEVFSLTFEPNGVLALQLRLGLQIDTVKGRWQLSGSSLTLQFGEVETIRYVAISVEMLAADRIRLTTLGRSPAAFRKTR